MVSNIAT